MSLFAVILAIDTDKHTAAVFEPEQEHTEACLEEGVCKCPVVGYELICFGAARTQSQREDFAQQAAEAGGGGHEETCEEPGECDCVTAPQLPVLVVTDAVTDLVTWGRWLAELEHVQVDTFIEVSLPRLFLRRSNSPDLTRAGDPTMRKLVGLPPVSPEVAFVLCMGQWAQTAPEALAAIQPLAAAARAAE